MKNSHFAGKVFKEYVIVFTVVRSYYVSDRSVRIKRKVINVTVCLGENIKRLRREKGITQEALAELLSVSFQSVSRWERGESYPDITLLPVLSGFFGVTVDELLGVNEARDEDELLKLLEEYDGLRWDVERKWKTLDILREKYPTDFRVQVRYLGKYIFDCWKDIDKHSSKITAIYENIQRGCTDDSIRMEAKQYYIGYLERMSCIENSGITFEDADKIIQTLPSIRYAKELNCFSYQYHTNSDEKVHETLEILIHTLFDVMLSWYGQSEKFPLDFQIEMQEAVIKALNFIYSDENYGIMWKAVISSCYGINSVFYYRKGDWDNALRSLKRTAELAVKFDSLDRCSTMHSPLFNGHIFDKDAKDRDFVAIRHIRNNMLNDYGFSDEFKATPEFREIISMLE
ncbi:MAG: helix-turn-helix transcriptional regulator [Clostridia bacterium]|nr:helix-turn-helix transcriptional regulator [Clostridia bacterium]